MSPDAYMFDTNIFNAVIDGKYDVGLLSTNSRYFTTHIQLDELKNTPTGERRDALLKVFNTIAATGVPTESAVWDVSAYDEAKWSDHPAIVPTESLVIGSSKLGLAKLGDGSVYQKLLDLLECEKPNHRNNRKDALIGETALKNGYILVTNDVALAESAKAIGGSVLNWREFLEQTTSSGS